MSKLSTQGQLKFYYIQYFHLFYDCKFISSVFQSITSCCTSPVILILDWWEPSYILILSKKIKNLGNMVALWLVASQQEGPRFESQSD